MTTNSFNITGADVKDAALMLKEMYKIECSKGDIEFQDDSHTRDSIIAVAEALVGKKKVILLMGERGSGKTTMARAICRLTGYIQCFFRESLIMDIEELTIDKFHELLELVNNMPVFQRKSFNEGVTSFVRKTSAIDLCYAAKDNTQKFHSLRQSRFLYIDDLGVEPETINNFGTKMMPIEEILYYRYDVRYPLLATTNFNKEDFSARYTPRIYDRLCETASFITITNKNYRQGL